MDVKEFEFDPPLDTEAGEVSTVVVTEIDEELYDLYNQDGECLNEGCAFVFIPTRKEVAEFVTTGEIKGKIE